MQRKSLLERGFALLVLLCLLPVAALGENQDAAMDALAGSGDVAADAVADPAYTDPAYVEQTYVQPTINMDADLRVGYVATGEINPFVCTDRDLVSLTSWCLNRWSSWMMR